MLRSSGEFVRYALSVAVQKIQQLEETGHTDGPDGQSSDRTFRFLCDMMRSESLSAHGYNVRGNVGTENNRKCLNAFTVS